MAARPMIQGETSKTNRFTIQYFDSLGRNTYYYNKQTEVWYEKRWVRLPDNTDREVYVESSNGYWRKHIYDNITNQLISEIDICGVKDLLHKRQSWNKQDTEKSLEIINKGKDKAISLF